ncbi:energy transducer TonB [Flammeovirga sp. SubArs3]|uniref:energy transducer TonB n=1 Tax=Flammeovirga sp. SubArs3 TaxID=2995316 RepID=UPI00248B70C9|nr:energy transducer TonB [Flammeovirga sp. SubArs3]
MKYLIFFSALFFIAPTVYGSISDELILSDTTVYENPEDPAGYPKGMGAFYLEVQKQIDYPISAFESKLNGKVYISFVVEKDGTVSNVLVERSLNEECDRAAKDIVKKLVPWIPAKNNEKLVRQKMMLPISFDYKARKKFLNKKS